jgi:hypothetical protein
MAAAGCFDVQFYVRSVSLGSGRISRAGSEIP